MKHTDLLNEFRELITQLRGEAEAASAMQLYDTHKVAENVICGLLRELCSYSNMRNLNAEQSNFPGIDLADDTERVAVQVTATADLIKVKNTLETFGNHQHHSKYDRVIIYILTTKQKSYSQAAINAILPDNFSFDVNNDIWDYQNLCSKAADVPPKNLHAAINHLKSYLRGVAIGLANEDIDPPKSPAETLFANLLQIYFPSNLHVAQLNADVMTLHNDGRASYLRKSIQSYCKKNELSVPSAYVAHAGALITFHDLERQDCPYRHIIEPGTNETLSSKEFGEIDKDHENVFKSLLRFTLQQRLFEERVLWYNDEKQFVFLPWKKDEDMRTEAWQGEKKSKRVVFVKQYNKKDRNKVFMQKHFSFSVDFHNFMDAWLMSVTPSWFFSYSDDFKSSGYGHENLSWIKRQENNRAVFNHFRFVAAWLKSIDEEDLFSQAAAYSKTSFLSFGDAISLTGAPSLDESKWAAIPDALEEDAMPPTQRLFGK